MTHMADGATLAIDGSLTLTEHMHLVGAGLGGQGALNVLSGSSTLNTNIGLDDNGSQMVTIQVANGATLTNNATFYSDGGVTAGITKTGSGTLVLVAPNTYLGNTTVAAGAIVLRQAPLFSDNFSANGNPNTLDLNYNLAGRQSGPLATQAWTGSGNAQVGNVTNVGQPAGVGGNYLLLAFTGSATLGNLPLSNSNITGPVKVSFDMYQGIATNGDSSEWTSFTLGSTAGSWFPVVGSGQIGFLYRNNTGIQLFNNNGVLLDLGSTSAGNSFSFYLADSTGTGSPFAGHGTELVLVQGATVLGTFPLDTGLGTSYITFGALNDMVGGVNNLAITPQQVDVLPATTQVNLSSATSTLALDNVQQTVAALNGVAGSSVAMSPFSHLTVNATADSTFAGVISGTLAGLTKSGSNSLTLTGRNTYTGGTTINGGSLVAAYHDDAEFTNNALGPMVPSNLVTVNTGGTLVAGDVNSLANVSGANDGSQSASFVVNGGKITNTAGKITGLGNLTLNGGTLEVNDGFDPGGWNAAYVLQGDVTVGGAAVSQITHPGGTAANIRLTSTSGNRNITVGAGSTLNVAAPLLDANGGGTSSLTLLGSGTVALSGSSSYSGVTTLAGGIANVATLSDYDAPGSLGNRASGSDGPGNVGILFQGGTLQYTGATAQSTNRAIRVSTVGGGATIDASGSVPSATVSFTAASSPDFFENGGDRTLTLTGTNTGNNTFGMAIGEAGGQTSVVKNGAGTWVLTGGNSYSGGTTVNAGTLRVNSSAGSGLVNVNAGTLGGNGTIAGPVNIASGATVTAGADAATTGTLTTGSMTWNGGGTYAWKLNGSHAGALHDMILVSGTGAFLDLSQLGSTFPSEQFTIQVDRIDGSSSAVPTGTQFVIADAPGINLPFSDSAFNPDEFVVTDPSGLDTWTISQMADSGSGQELVLTATAISTPEPGSLGLLGLGALGLLRRRRTKSVSKSTAECNTL